METYDDDLSRFEGGRSRAVAGHTPTKATSNTTVRGSGTLRTVPARR